MPKAKRDEVSYLQIIREKYDYVARQVFEAKLRLRQEKRSSSDLEEFATCRKAIQRLKRRRDVIAFPAKEHSSSGIVKAGSRKAFASSAKAKDAFTITKTPMNSR